MKVLVIDPDPSIQEYYTHILRAEFPDLEIVFKTVWRTVSEYLETQEPDLILLDNRIDQENFFDLLENLMEEAIPVVVISSDTTPRFIVECMRIGARDFLNKRYIKLGHLPSIVIRTLYETERWKQVHSYQKTLPQNEDFLLMNQHIRSFLKDDQLERKRNLISRGIVPEGPHELMEGEWYRVIFLFLNFYVTPATEAGMDIRRLSEIKHVIMTRISEIPLRYGGLQWMRTEDLSFYAFIGDSYISAILAAMEIHAAMNVFNVTIEHMVERLSASIGMADGLTMYRENKGEIVSDALNLSAHMAFHQPEENNIMISRSVFENLWPRAKRYFEEAPLFEGQQVLKYKSIV